MTVAIAAVAITAIGISRRGLGVSSARLAAVSKPTNSSTPYSTPKKMPDQPSAADDGLNGLRLFAEPSLTITKMKKMPTTTIETSASASWLRVEIRTPKYRIARDQRDQQQRPGPRRQRVHA